MFFRFFKYEVNIVSRHMCGSKFRLIPIICGKQVGFQRDLIIYWLGGAVVISRRT